MNFVYIYHILLCFFILFNIPILKVISFRILLKIKMKSLKNYNNCICQNINLNANNVIFNKTNIIRVIVSSEKTINNYFMNI